jgi:hypothetical protein
MCGMIDCQDSNFEQILTTIHLVLANNSCPRRKGGIVIFWRVKYRRNVCGERIILLHRTICTALK